MNAIDVKYDVFLSYHWRDHAYVEQVASQLHDSGIRIFLDRWYLIPGRPWIAELENILYSCRAIAVFIGPGEMGPWQQREKNFALERQAADATFPVIPVLLPGSDPALGFLNQNTWVDLRLGVRNVNELRRFAGAIRGESPNPQSLADRSASGLCPYRGLLYFREEDGPFFFGREVATQHLLHAVENRWFVIVVGASGSGKSSLVRAGLVPQLRRKKDVFWETIVIRPNDQPLHQLARALLHLLKPTNDPIGRASEVDRLAQDFATNTVRLRNLALEYLATQEESTRLMLIVDQWEELYTLTEADSIRRCFIEQILDATQSHSLNVTATLRGDFVGMALVHRALSDELQDAQINLGPMTREELEKAIVCPADQVGLRFEPGLVPRILDDVGEEPGNLPLLEFVLKRLWEDRCDQEMVHASYDAMGQLEGAVASKAEEIFASLSLSDQEQAQKVFMELVRVGTGGSDTRRRARLETLGGPARQLVTRLSNDRLLVTAYAESSDHETVEVSHEALIHNWKRLKEWLDEDREFLAWRDRFRGQLQAWRENRRDEGSLLRGTLLLVSEGRLQARASDLNFEDRQFIETSVALRTREERKRKTIISLIVVFFIVTSIAIVALFRERSHTNQEKERAHAFKLSVVASDYLSQDPELGVLLAYQAAQETYSSDRSNIHETRALLEKASHIPIPRTLGIANGRLIDAAIDRRGRVVAIAGEGGLVQLWNVGTGQIYKTFSDHGEFITSIAFSEDGSKIVTAGWDKTARVWDTTSGKETLNFLGHADHVFQAVFAPDAKSVGTAGKDGTARIWDVATGRELFRLPSHEKKVYAVTFSPDGILVATGSADTTIHISNASTGKLMRTLKGHTGEVYSIAFSPDGDMLASAGRDGTIRLWEVNSGRTSGVLSGHTDSIFKVAFNVLGNQLVTASADHTIRLWNPYDGRELATLRGHKEEVTAVTFSPDATFLVSASSDKTVRIWPISQMQKFLIGHASAVLGIVFSPDGSTIATSSHDGTARIWDAKSGRHLLSLVGHRSQVNKVAFSQDGQFLATASGDGTAKLWDVVSGTNIRTLNHHEAEVTSVSFSPDGKTLATAAKDHKARMWDTSSGGLLRELSGHENMVQSVVFSPDGTRMATGSFDTTAKVWDVKSGKVIFNLAGHERSVEAIAFSADGNYLATGSADKIARVWDAHTGKSLLTMKGHINSVIDLTFAPNSKQLATASPDGTVKIWSIPTGELVHTVTNLDDQVRALAYSPDGSRIAIGRSKSLGQLLDFDDLTPKTDEELLRQVARKRTRAFTKPECREFFGRDECNS